MNLFLPDAGLVVWMLIAFSLVFFVLAKFAWPTILSSIKEREEHIADSLKKADDAIELDTSYMSIEEVVDFIYNKALELM